MNYMERYFAHRERMNTIILKINKNIFNDHNVIETT